MSTVAPTTIDLLPEPTTDEWGTVTIGRWGGWLVQIMPMLFNDRLVLTPEQAPCVYDYGWCFPKGGAAHLAAIVWNPETEAEPAGYKKAIYYGQPRQTGETRAMTVQIAYEVWKATGLQEYGPQE